MREYPYIQNKTKIIDFICDDCKQLKATGFNVEWRVDIFQGNCEFEKTCETCLIRQLHSLKIERIRREKQRRIQEERYENHMRPKWERLERMLKENKVEVKKYPVTGQWTFNNLIDWWTTTGTAIHRKTKQEFNFTVEKPEQMLKVLISFKPINELRK